MPRSKWDDVQADLARVTAERDAMAGVVEAARAWAAVSGHAMPGWNQCNADLPEDCAWLDLTAALARLDATQQKPT